MADEKYERLVKPIWVKEPAKDARVTRVQTKVERCCAFCGVRENSIRGRRVVILDEHGFCAYCAERGVERA